MKAFVTGVTGQDGHYLVDLLNEKGYEVYGLVRRSSQEKNIPDCKVVEGDVTDSSISRDIDLIKPDEVYNLAAMSHVHESFKIPRTTFCINAMGTLNLLEACRGKPIKFYQASTSELFGISEPPQNEQTRFHPRSPYGAAKLAAFYLTVNYREAYGLHACNGILFNHESPIRGKDFVTQKICEGVARIKLGLQHKLVLGNLDAERDWGHAKDYVKAMWLMLQHKPDDYVVATGKTCSVREFSKMAFEAAGLHNWHMRVETNEKYVRPSEVPSLRGDPSKIEALGWEREYSLQDLVREMVECAIDRYTESLKN